MILGPNVTIIDTPGFGDNIQPDEEESRIEELVDVLKNDVQWVHVFVLTFNGESPRLTRSLRSMIKLFEKMFGNLFWNNAMFEVTRWAYDERSKRNRIESNESEEKWQKDWNKKFRDLFEIVSSIFSTGCINLNANDIQTGIA